MKQRIKDFIFALWVASGFILGSAILGFCLGIFMAGCRVASNLVNK
jgi:hypothetical protein